jgi:hypothetical protein
LSRYDPKSSPSDCPWLKQKYRLLAGHKHQRRAHRSVSGGAAGQAALLVEEGFTIDTKGKVSKVKNFRESLVCFD